MSGNNRRGWDSVLLKDFLTINPLVSLVKGNEYTFIAMEDIAPGNRYISSVKGRKFKGGGSRFGNGDVLFARITPCLENGKISQVKNPEGGKGFGSTEFYVFRERDGISDSSFVYYLAISDLVRKPAEKSMSGASGRQRADKSTIENLELILPPLPTQHKIASILSAYDELTENNTRRIKILEEMAQAIYKEWFINFRFPEHEKAKMIESELGLIPEGWEVKRLGEVCEIVMGQSPKSEFYNTNGQGLPFHQGVKDFGTRFPTHTTYCTVDRRIAERRDILLSVRAPVGRLNIANTKIIIGRGLAALRHKKLLQSFLLYQLKNIFSVEDSMGSGAIFNAITKGDLGNVKFLVSSNGIDIKFNEIVSSIDNKIENVQSQIENLRHTRDLLLPKLISGEIDVEELDINNGRFPE